MDQSTNPPLSIYDATERCRGSFLSCLYIKDLMDNEWAENRLADFNLWAAGVGASASREACLDTRLSDDPGTYHVVVGLLMTLEAYVGCCKKLALRNNLTIPLGTSSTDDKDDERLKEMSLREAIEGTEELLGELIKSGVAIRKAGTSSHLRNADRFFDPQHRPKFREHLVQIVLGRPSTVESSRQLQDGQAKFDFRKDLLSSVQQCLVTANLKRRNRFIYARNHGKKLAAQRKKALFKPPGHENRAIEVKAITKEVDPTETRAQAVGEGKQNAENTPVRGDQRPSPSASGESLYTKHSEFSRILDLDTPEPTPSKRAISQISSTALKITYPRRPPKATKLQSFTCPCCWRTLSSKINSIEWQKHIAEDLCPYTCLFPDCPEGDTLYVKREAWKAHMNKCHRSTPYWQCFACEQSFKKPGAMEELITHLKTSHHGIISDDMLSMMVDVCIKTDPPEFNTCPLCSWAQEQALRAHMSDHHGYSLDFEDLNYWECFACRISQKFDDREDIEGHQKDFHPGSCFEDKLTLVSEDNGTHEWKCSPCSTLQIFGSEGDLEAHAKNFHLGITAEDRLPEFVEMCGMRYPHSDQSCPLCFFPMEQVWLKEPNSIIDHIAEHIHSFSLYSLPWSERTRNEEDDSEGDEKDEDYFGEDDYFADDDEDSNRAWVEGEAGDNEGRKHADGILEHIRERLAQEGQSKAISRVRWNVPFKRNPEFVGRHSEFARLGNTIFAEDRPSKLAISGPGGMGKTQIMVELAYRIRENYPECSIFWIPATDTERLQQAYLEVGRQLGIPRLEEEQVDVKWLVKRYLSQESVGKWLLIFDGADDIDMWVSKEESDSYSLVDCLPKSRQGCIVFTTRSREIAAKLARSSVIEVSEMDEEVATWLLSKSLINKGLLDSHQDIWKLLFGKSADLDSRNEYGRTMLSRAAGNGKGVVMKLLLEKGADLESKDRDGWTPLSWAAGNGHDVVVKQLVEKGADLESKDVDGRTPLSWAAGNGHDVTAKLLIEKGAELESKDGDGWTPLLWAAGNGHEAVVKLLVEKGADLESKDGDDRTALLLAAGNSYDVVVKLLLELDAELESNDGDGRTPLSWAAENGHDAVVKLLVQRGAELESKDRHCQTALSWAARNRHDVVVKLLLEKGADLNSSDLNGRTSLSWTAGNGHSVVVKQLVEKGANLESKDVDGRTPLSWAARNRHDVVVKLLLEKGANLNSSDLKGRTSLSLAAGNGHSVVVKQLVEKGAKLESKDVNGRTPLSWAARNGHDAVVKLLLERGADLNSRDGDGRTSLSEAAMNGHDIVVKLLNEKGADLESKDPDGQTALSLAAG